MQERNPQQGLSVDIVPFKFKHFKALIDLHESQKYKDILCLSYRTLPKVGFIAMLGDQPIACGFLRRLEPCFAQIDTLVSNAYFGSAIRHDGISKVVNALIEEAKRLKLEGLIAHTADAGTLLRAEGLGFRVSDQSIIVLPLG